VHIYIYMILRGMEVWASTPPIFFHCKLSNYSSFCPVLGTSVIKLPQHLFNNEINIHRSSYLISRHSHIYQRSLMNHIQFRSHCFMDTYALTSPFFRWQQLLFWTDAGSLYIYHAYIMEIIRNRDSHIQDSICICLHVIITTQHIYNHGKFFIPSYTGDGDDCPLP